MRGGARKGSFFFVIDAFLAGAILVMTIVLIFALFLNQRHTEQSFTYAQDYLSFLTATQVRDYHDPAVDALRIADRRKTLAEQVLIFENATNHSAMWTIIDSTSASLPKTIALNVSILKGAYGAQQSVHLYNRSIGEIPKKQAHLVAKTIQYALVNESNLYGPLTLKVEVWS